MQKERLRQKKNHKKVIDLSKQELKERREVVRKRIQEHRQHSKATQKVLETSRHNTNSDTAASSPEPQPFFVAMNFPKSGESSRKLKRQRDKQLHKKIARLEDEKKALSKKNATLRQRMHRMKKTKKN